MENLIMSNFNVFFVVDLKDIALYRVILNLIRFGSIALAICAIYMMIGNYRTTLYEKRIGKYSVKPLKDDYISIFDKIGKLYYHLISKVRRLIKKSTILCNHSKRYEKYVGIVNPSYESGIDYLTSKFIIAFTILLLAIISRAFQLHFLTIYEMVVPLVIGYFMPNMIYIVKYKLHQNRVENDMLQAIIIMNNAFKSGRSLTQAIDLVSEELDGPISIEFKKMSEEISYGLGIDVVFKRFADRIQIDEVNYLTASLTVLNKTGGNIIKVFTTIEKSLFDKKRLKLELESLTSGSRLIMYCLIAVPVLFVIFISVINPGYFEIFYTTKIGVIMLLTIISLYILYIVIVRKIMRVRM